MNGSYFPVLQTRMPAEWCPQHQVIHHCDQGWTVLPTPELCQQWSHDCQWSGLWQHQKLSFHGNFIVNVLWERLRQFCVTDSGLRLAFSPLLFKARWLLWYAMATLLCGQYCVSHERPFPSQLLLPWQITFSASLLVSPAASITDCPCCRRNKPHGRYLQALLNKRTWERPTSLVCIPALTNCLLTGICQR